MDVSNLNMTPSSERVHIVFMGRMNSGKSSLINALTGQHTSIVSEVRGTTTDPVRKAMEINGIGPCVLVDTAGFDDTGELGEKRAEKAANAADLADIVVMTICDNDVSLEKQWYDRLMKKGIPVIIAITKTDLDAFDDETVKSIEQIFNSKPVITSVVNNLGVDELLRRLVLVSKDNVKERFITGNLVSAGDVVLLIMPQDIQAPKGRLILPQVQTIRELLDRGCIVISTTAEKMKEAIGSLKEAPKLVITDSQVFKKVYDIKPEESMLTSFSTLFAAYKGDIDAYVNGAENIQSLTKESKVLIAECCTHAPMQEDIGRVKIPGLLRKRFGETIQIDVVSGMDFPEDLSSYDLIIQCGACMFNRRYVMSRIERAKEADVPITNYGIAIAWLNGILDKIELPKGNNLDNG